MTTYLVYDGTFDGFLTCLFERYDRKLSHVEITRSHRYQPTLDSACLEITTDSTKSCRVWTGLKKRLSVRKRNEFYKTFLSEMPEMERVLTSYAAYLFSNTHKVDEDLSHPSVIAVNKIAHQVHREKHRMEAFIRFQRTKEDLYYAAIDPDFNVLPLIVKHFKERYADQHWLIYDLRRKYGVSHDCSIHKVTEVQLDLTDDASAGPFLPAHLCHEDELAYQKLWKDYFNSVNIGARKNTRLHVRHVPTRYWKYLTEKREA